MADISQITNELLKRAESDDDQFEDCETDPEAVAILVVIIFLVLGLIALGWYLYKRAQAKKQQRVLAWRDFVPRWLNFNENAPGGPYGPQMSWAGSQYSNGPIHLPPSAVGTPNPHWPGSRANSDYGIHSGHGTPQTAYHTNSGGGTGYFDHKGGSGYIEGSGFTAGSGRSGRQGSGRDRQHRGDDHSINSYDSYEDAPRQRNAPSTPASAKQRALQDAWDRARTGSGSSGSRPARPSRANTLDSISEASQSRGGRRDRNRA